MTIYDTFHNESRENRSVEGRLWQHGIQSFIQSLLSPNCPTHEHSSSSQVIWDVDPGYLESY